VPGRARKPDTTANGDQRPLFVDEMLESCRHVIRGKAILDMAIQKNG